MPGLNYIMQGTTNLAPANWTPLATNLADGNGSFQFTDPRVTDCPSQFYRIVSP